MSTNQTKESEKVLEKKKRELLTSKRKLKPDQQLLLENEKEE